MANLNATLIPQGNSTVRSSSETDLQPKNLFGSLVPLLESAFDRTATSVTNTTPAVGLWQFMEKTARDYHLITPLGVDNRTDPVESTKAAANMFLADYRRLGRWDLAIIAYNCGQQNLINRQSLIKSTELSDIILSPPVAPFGFNSTNYYPRFLAAVEVYDDYIHSIQAKTLGSHPSAIRDNTDVVLSEKSFRSKN